MICEKENIEKTKKKEHIDKKARILPWLFFSLIILTTVWIRYNSLDIPLERDEGEYAYGGQILLQGIPPYKKLYNMKFPGIYAVYAVLMYLFGQTHTGIHFALLFVNLIATIFVYMIARKLYGLTGALTAAASFAILSVGQPVQGIFANAEHFVILPVLVGIFLLLQTNTKSRKYLLFLAGFFLGIGFIIKQHGIFFILFGAIFLCFEAFWNNQDTAKIRKIILKKTGLFFLGVLIPYLLTCLLLYRAGVFAKFWFWTMKYVGSYTTQRSLSQAWSTLKISFSSIFTASPLLWLLAVTGVFLVFTYKDRKKLVFIIGLFLFSFLAVCPGGFFRPHYFVLVLPVSALLIGLTIDFLDRLPYKKDMQWLRQWFPITLAVISLTVSLYIQRDFLFKMSLNQIITKIYWPNPFNESLEIARKIKEDCKPNDTIAIMGSEPHFFFIQACIPPVVISTCTLLWKNMILL